LGLGYNLYIMSNLVRVLFRTMSSAGRREKAFLNVPGYSEYLHINSSVSARDSFQHKYNQLMANRTLPNL
jgi:hypothetical protein